VIRKEEEKVEDIREKLEELEELEEAEEKVEGNVFVEHVNKLRAAGILVFMEISKKIFMKYLTSECCAYIL
jgi:selenocysteine-specific translation elongation factor